MSTLLQGSAGRAAAANKSADEIFQKFGRLYQGWDDGLAQSCLSQNCKLHGLWLDERDINGFNEARVYFEVFRNGFSNLLFRVNDISASGHTVLGRFTLSGKHTGTFLSQPASNNEVNVEGMLTVSLDANNRINEAWCFWDKQLFLDQLHGNVQADQVQQYGQQTTEKEQMKTFTGTAVTGIAPATVAAQPVAAPLAGAAVVGAGMAGSGVYAQQGQPSIVRGAALTQPTTTSTASYQSTGTTAGYQQPAATTAGYQQPAAPVMASGYQQRQGYVSTTTTAAPAGTVGQQSRGSQFMKQLGAMWDELKNEFSRDTSTGTTATGGAAYGTTAYPQQATTAPLYQTAQPVYTTQPVAAAPVTGYQSTAAPVPHAGLQPAPVTGSEFGQHGTGLQRAEDQITNWWNKWKTSRHQHQQQQQYQHMYAAQPGGYNPGTVTGTTTSTVYKQSATSTVPPPAPVLGGTQTYTRTTF